MASLIDEKPWAALMAWALDDVVARRIRSSDEKTEKLSGEYLVAMDVSGMVKTQVVESILYPCLFFLSVNLGSTCITREFSNGIN